MTSQRTRMLITELVSVDSISVDTQVNARPEMTEGGPDKTLEVRPHSGFIAHCPVWCA